MFQLIKINFTVIVSLTSLALSIYNFFYSLIIKKKKISITFCSYIKESNDDNFDYIFKVIINNHSQLPISINSISINDSTCENSSNYIYKLTSKEGSTVTDERKIYPLELPINLSSLMSAGGFVIFKNCSEIDFNNIFITLYTNRGAIKDCHFVFDKNFKEISSFDL